MQDVQQVRVGYEHAVCGDPAWRGELSGLAGGVRPGRGGCIVNGSHRSQPGSTSRRCRRL